MKRIIKHTTIIGSEIIGSEIACQFANIGVQVLILDFQPKKLNNLEIKKKYTLESSEVRNRIVNENLQKTINLSPNSLYKTSFLERIKTGNIEDDLSKIIQSDWIIEAVIENLDIKQSIYKKIEKYRKKGTLISSNTSKIPLYLLLEGRSKDFKKHFAGTHFFNPVRYIPLIEIIPTKETLPKVKKFYINYGDLFLGKTTILCKDTPFFIANRIRIFSIMSLLHYIKKLNLSVVEIDDLTGPIIGHQNSATFGSLDFIGLDIFFNNANKIFKTVKNDEANSQFQIPNFIKKMIKNKWLGNKTQQGFYKKIITKNGLSKIMSLNLNTLKYECLKKTKFQTIEMIKNTNLVIDRFKVLISGTDKAGIFYRKYLANIFSYVSFRIPEISNTLYQIDDAMSSGFKWEHGPFKIWDSIGIENGLKLIKQHNLNAAHWVYKMIQNKNNSFYKFSSLGKLLYYNSLKEKYEYITKQSHIIILDSVQKNKIIWKNNTALIKDLGDGILNLEICSKINSIKNEVIYAINKGIDIAEKNYRGLVIANQKNNFYTGDNLAMIFTLASSKKYNNLYFYIKSFQNTIMRIRYSSIPVIICPHEMTLSGGCELTMHADKVIATPETYIGFIEFNIGIIPAGGGSKEFTKRIAESFQNNEIETKKLLEAYHIITLSKITNSAYEAYDLGFFQKHKDLVIMNKNRQILEAKKQAIILYEFGYSMPIPNKFKVLGKNAMGIFYVDSDQMVTGNYISEHDKLIANKLAYVMTGGNLSEPTLVSEKYLLKLEREVFISLCKEKKTLDRIKYMISTGKTLKN